MTLALDDIFGSAAPPVKVVPVETPTLDCGIHHGISDDFYHRLPYLGSTTLKKYRDNPAGSLLPFVPTDDMNIGSAIHSFSLQGEQHFKDNFAVMFTLTLNKNTNEFKSLKAEFIAAAGSKTVLPAEYKGVPTMEVIRSVDNSLRTHPVAGAWMKQGAEELTLIWDDPSTGRRCKARVDFNPGRKVLVDLKKCANVNKFKNQMVDLNYDVQSGHYTNGAIACGLPVDTFAFVAVEAEEPYEVLCGIMSDEWLAWSQLEALRLVGLYDESVRTNNFPNYRLPSHVQTLAEVKAEDLLTVLNMPTWRV